jgi:putative ABC transport system permease protein
MIGETIRVAIEAIWAQKLRSVLTMLGVIIGVAAVITLVSLASGATSTVSKSIQGLGSNLIVVVVGPQHAGPNTGVTTVAPPATLSPSQALLLGRIPGIQADAPVIAGGATLGVGSATSTAGVIGTGPAYQTVLDYRMAEGRFLSPLDVQEGQNVIVLGAQEAQNLFGSQDPVGNTVTVNGVPFQVIGVTAPKGSIFGQSQDTFAAIPWTVAESLFGQNAVASVYLSAKPTADMTQVQNRINVMLLGWLGSAQNFSVTTQAEVLSTLASVTGVLTTLLGGVASISLIVGGIGIMNIMLVSVTERTREIGIRKAIGASHGAILLQFLIEALTLAGLGGLIGIGLGAVVSAGLGSALGIATTFAPGTALLAFVFSLAVGLVFGLWPASRAAGLHPVDALRVE